jgi:hypothetical protein
VDGTALVVSADLLVGQGRAYLIQIKELKGWVSNVAFRGNMLACQRILLYVA